jgi:hypothetical protein
MSKGEFRIAYILLFISVQLSVITVLLGVILHRL